MDTPFVVTPQHKAIHREWPRTATALERTYCQAQAWAVTYGLNQNDAGYALWGLRQYEVHANNILAHRAYTRDELDVAAAREVLYHAARGSQFRRPVAALSKCVYNLVHERPEKLEAARRWLHAHRSNATEPTSPTATTQQTGTHSPSYSETPRSTGPCRIGSVLRASMPRS